MYHSYSFYGMKPKANMFRSSYVSSTSSYTYEDWASRLEGYGAAPWRELSERFAETFQFALLRGLAVTGIAGSDWNSVFRDVHYEASPFQSVAKLYLQGQLQADWRFFAQKLARETYNSTHYPSLCPEWLFAYGYPQQQYLSDLTVYWDGIPDDYYKPWATTRIGQDSPEVARLKKIGQEARREIDEVARRSSQHIKR